MISFASIVRFITNLRMAQVNAALVYTLQYKLEKATRYKLKPPTQVVIDRAGEWVKHVPATPDEPSAEEIAEALSVLRDPRQRAAFQKRGDFYQKRDPAFDCA